MTTITDTEVRPRYCWPADDELGGRVYERLTEAETEALTADELREAIRGSGSLMRDVEDGLIYVFDLCAMRDVIDLTGSA